MIVLSILQFLFHPFQKIEFKVFPNPFENEINIIVSEPININAFKIKLYNSLRKLVKLNSFTKSINSITVKTELLPSGIYILELKSDNQLFYKRVVKM